MRSGRFVRKSRSHRSFTLKYWVDDGWYVGALEEVPGVFSQGATLAELERNVRDAYKMMLREQPSIAPRGAKTKDLGVHV